MKEVNKMKRKVYIVVFLAALLLCSCATSPSPDTNGAIPGVVTPKSFPSINYEGFTGEADNGALVFAKNNASVAILENMFDTVEENDVTYILIVKAEGTGLNVKSTNHFNTFMGPMMGTLATSFLLNYIGSDMEINPVIYTGAGLSLTAALLSILAILPDKTTAVFDGTYTVLFMDAESGEKEYEESFTIDPVKTKFDGSYEKDGKCVNEINGFYGVAIRNRIERIVEKVINGGLK